MIDIYIFSPLTFFVGVCMCVWVLIEGCMFLCVWCFMFFWGFEQKEKVLMVGAGGIGCELLKTLVLTGFKHIHLVSQLLYFCIGNLDTASMWVIVFFLTYMLVSNHWFEHVVTNVNHRKTLAELSVVLKVHICSFWISRTISSIFSNMRRTLKTWTA